MADLASIVTSSSDELTDSSSDSASLPNHSKRKRRRCFSTDDGAKKNKLSCRCTDSELSWESNEHEVKSDVSIWTKEQAEMYGLFYEKKTSTFSEFYDLFDFRKGKSRHGFIYPLEGEDKEMLDSLVEQTNGLIEEHGVEMETGWEWAVAADWPFVWTKCCNAVRVLNESCRPAVYSGNHVRCYAAVVNFYLALRDFVREEIQRSNSCPPSDVPQGIYTELCAKFFEIFLLISRRGKLRKSVMIIKDIATSSFPDLRLKLSTFSSPCLFAVDVVSKINRSALDRCVPFNIHQALDKQLLGRHAGELLLDFQLSAFRDLQAVFGIICLQTTLIFTCLKISTKHYQFIHEFGEDVVIKGKEVDNSFDWIKTKLDDDEKDDNNENTCHAKETTASTKSNLRRNFTKSGTIFYTKPYNFLISKDRKEMMEFLFWIGINCARVTVSSA